MTISRLSSLPRQMIYLSLVSSLLGGCGFHLRGQHPLPAIIKTVAVESGEHAFENMLADRLEDRGATVIRGGEEQAVPTIQITHIAFERSVNTRDSSGSATGYRYRYEIDFRIVDGAGQVLIPTRSLVQKRTQKFDPAEVLQLEEEEQFLKTRMEEELILQMMRQINRL